jgi:hypothetical protein
MLSWKIKELSPTRDVGQPVFLEICLSFSRAWLIHTKRLIGQQPDPTPRVEQGIDSVYYMGTLEDREEFTWSYLLPGWEPQSAVGMGSEPPPKSLSLSRLNLLYLL